MLIPCRCSSFSSLALLALLASLGTSSVRSGLLFTTLGVGIFQQALWDFCTGADMSETAEWRYVGHPHGACSQRGARDGKDSLQKSHFEKQQ